MKSNFASNLGRLTQRERERERERRRERGREREKEKRGAVRPIESRGASEREENSWRCGKRHEIPRCNWNYLCEFTLQDYVCLFSLSSTRRSRRIVRFAKDLKRLGKFCIRTLENGNFPSRFVKSRGTERVAATNSDCPCAKV